MQEEKVFSDSDWSFRLLCFEVSGLVRVVVSDDDAGPKAHMSFARVTCSGCDLFRPRIRATYLEKLLHIKRKRLRQTESQPKVKNAYFEKNVPVKSKNEKKKEAYLKKENIFL